MYAQKNAYDSLINYYKSVYSNYYFPRDYVDSVNEALKLNNRIGPNPPPPSCCNDICITGTFTANSSSTTPTGWCGTSIPGTGSTSNWTYTPGMTDPFGSTIWFTGKYGTDERQKYYVYYPTNKTAASPIAVLIHGGGWFMGPNPQTVNGFEFKFAPASSTTSLVKELLNNGYVVVSLLYRLAQYVKPEENLADNAVSMQMQIDDIGSAINHIHTYFPTCLDLNANSIQVLGESAGGHLALMWAYTQAAPSYIKSVISMYAPSDMQKFVLKLQDKKCWNTTTSCNYTCGNDFFVGGNGDILRYIPIYFNANLNNTFKTYGSVSPLSCSISANDQNWLTTQCNLSPNNPIVCNTNYKILDAFRMIESAIKTPISDASTDANLLNMSPYHALNSDHIIPSFIMHGTNDHIVPLSWIDNNNNIKNALISFGGLISGAIYANTAIPASTTYATTTQKHLMKTYTGAPHGWSDPYFASVRADVITWFNGHK